MTRLRLANIAMHHRLHVHGGVSKRRIALVILMTLAVASAYIYLSDLLWIDPPLRSLRSDYLDCRAGDGLGYA